MNGAALMNAGKADICLNWSGKACSLHLLHCAISQVCTESVFAIPYSMRRLFLRHTAALSYESALSVLLLSHMQWKVCYSAVLLRCNSSLQAVYLRYPRLIAKSVTVLELSAFLRIDSCFQSSVSASHPVQVACIMPRKQRLQASAM